MDKHVERGRQQNVIPIKFLLTLSIHTCTLYGKRLAVAETKIPLYLELNDYGKCNLPAWQLHNDDPDTFTNNSYLQFIFIHTL